MEFPLPARQFSVRGADAAPRSWLLPGQPDCRPEVVVELQGNYIGGDQSLPPTRRTPGWFFPVLVGLFVVVLNAALVLFNLATRPAHQAGP